MGPDYRVLVARARKMAHAYKLEKGEDIPTSQLVSKVATVMQEYTQSGGVRPFGVSLLIAGFDKVCTLIPSFTLLSTAKALNSCVPSSDSFDLVSSSQKEADDGALHWPRLVFCFQKY